MRPVHRHLIRRTAFRAASSTPTSWIAQSRSINTCSPFLFRSKVQATGISPSVFRRFASDDVSSPSSADGESSSVSSAVDSATETASTYASEAAESVSETAQEAKDTFVDTAAGTAAAAGLAYQPREDRRESRPSRDGDSRGGYGGDRNGGGRSFDRNNRNGGGRSFDRGDRGGDRRGPPRDAPELTPTTSVYIGNLLFDVTAADLEREFGQFGEIKSATIATDPRGMSKGFGYVEFESLEQSAAAIEAKHQEVFEGRRLVVNYQNKTRRNEATNPPSKTLFIGNLAFEMSDADLNKLFRDIRNVVDVRVAIDRRTGQPRGFAHADFVDVDSAVKGMETLKGQEIYGRKLRVDYSLGNKERANEGGASGFGGGRPQSNF
ncbi:ribonucleoprotein-like protein [Lachnellula arida]|uniref:Ribonucleoprotein-like protein n=1 Tax=Lachnellula arida TaxID=1316785 RepID=A0A8T9B5F9_9HELO|nr:ribonucleoprotein-like protein [Lachnellula arida]